MLLDLLFRQIGGGADQSQERAAWLPRLRKNQGRLNRRRVQSAHFDPQNHSMLSYYFEQLGRLGAVGLDFLHQIGWDASQNLADRQCPLDFLFHLFADFRNELAHVSFHDLGQGSLVESRSVSLQPIPAQINLRLVRKQSFGNVLS